VKFATKFKRKIRMQKNDSSFLRLEEWVKIYRPLQDVKDPESYLRFEDIDPDDTDGFIWSEMETDEGIFIIPGMYATQARRFYSCARPYSSSTWVVEKLLYNRRDGIEETLDEIEIDIKHNLEGWKQNPIECLEALREILLKPPQNGKEN
jgi:hypothetical protein